MLGRRSWPSHAQKLMSLATFSTLQVGFRLFIHVCLAYMYAAASFIKVDQRYGNFHTSFKPCNVAWSFAWSQWSTRERQKGIKWIHYGKSPNGNLRRQGDCQNKLDLERAGGCKLKKKHNRPHSAAYRYWTTVLTYPDTFTQYCIHSTILLCP